MDSPLFSHKVTLVSVAEAVRQGDWARAESLVASLDSIALPTGHAELGEYLDSLRETLLTARIARSHLGAACHRIAAASSFSGGSDVPPVWRKAAASAES